MQYNTQKKHLRMPEYGRAVQDMVELAVNIQDRKQRQQCAETIVRIMSNINPEIKDEVDREAKLWTHLAIISDYQLDVDYPVTITPEKEIQEHPEPLQYPTHKIRHRHYGHVLESYLEQLATMPEGEEREQLTQLVADRMKFSLFNWNRDAMENENIARDLSSFTQGRVELDLDTFSFGSVQNVPTSYMSKNKKKKR